MPDWLSHALTAVTSFAGGGGLFLFLLKRRQQDIDERTGIISDLRDRVAKLESRLDAIHDEHANCLQAQARLQAEIDMLKAERGDEK